MFGGTLLLPMLISEMLQNLNVYHITCMVNCQLHALFHVNTVSNAQMQ